MSEMNPQETCLKHLQLQHLFPFKINGLINLRALDLALKHGIGEVAAGQADE